MHSKSQLATDLKSWRGRDFTPEERDNFDLRNILGKPCLLSIAHQESSDGKTTYANISAISNKMKSYTPKTAGQRRFCLRPVRPRLGELWPP
ncbi:phage replication initiation protein, NGO0469 family [Neisseria gonorrhoeae]|uniref:phage replication initiation protein, NGO0469 family n=1 Tax=Neisseria gonorrhoeae TaxID=485 RepID=UPI0037CA756B